MVHLNRRDAIYRQYYASASPRPRIASLVFQPIRDKIRLVRAWLRGHKNNPIVRTMQRVLGLLLIALAVVGALAQRLVGLNDLVGEALQAVLGPYVTKTFHSPVGEAVVYGFFYFIAACGLVLVAVSNPVRKAK